MFKNFDWHHWALLVVGLIVTAGPDVAQSLGSNGVTGAEGTIARVVAFCTIILSMLKESPMPPKEAK